MLSMKFFCLVLFVAGVCCGDEDDSTSGSRKNDVVECARKYDIDMKILKGLYIDPNFAPTRSQQCFAACVMKKRRLMDESGKFTKLYHETDLGEGCKSGYGKDECETASKVIYCIARIDLMDKMKGNSGES